MAAQPLDRPPTPFILQTICLVCDHQMESSWKEVQRKSLQTTISLWSSQCVYENQNHYFLTPKQDGQ